MEKISELSPKNSLWGIRDCGGEGDCLFLCIEEALKNFYEPEDDTYSVPNLRSITQAECVNEDNFEIILQNYKAEDNLENLMVSFIQMKYQK